MKVSERSLGASLVGSSWREYKEALEPSAPSRSLLAMSIRPASVHSASFFDHSDHKSSNATVIISSSSHHCTAFGGLLPVLVVEAISSEDLPLRSHQSLRITDDGWALLICGRKIFVWNFLSETSNKANSCYELDLPPSDLAFKADHLAILPSPNTSSPGLMAVSPEGFIRYWSNIAYDTACVECTVHDLGGQECALLHRVSDSVCVVATTTNTLIQVVLGPLGITCRTLKAPQGMLTGFSKKFTSFIFGGGIANSAENVAKSFTKVFHVTLEDGPTIIYSFSGSSVQKWLMEGNQSEQLLMEQDLSRSLRSSYLSLVLDSHDSAQSELLIIDAASVKPFIINLLVASQPRSVSERDVFMALATLEDSTQVPGTASLVSFKPIRNSKNLLRITSEDQLVHLKLLFTQDCNSFAIYDDSRIFFVRNFNIIDSIDFDARDDGLLGAGFCQDVPLIFSIKEGLLSIKCNLLDVAEKSDTVADATDFSSLNEKKIDAIRRALQLFSNDQHQEAIQLLASSFDISLQGVRLLSSLIYQLADDILDGESKELVAGKGRAFENLLLLRTIEQKLGSITKLVELSKSVSPILAEAKVSSSAGQIPLLLALNDQLERILVLHSLKCRQSDYYHLLHPSLASLHESLFDHQDLQLMDQFINVDFFLKATSVGQIIPELIAFEEKSVNSPNFNPEELLQLLLSVSDLLADMFSEVLSARGKICTFLPQTARNSENFEPWDAVSVIRGALLRHLDILSTKGFQLASTSDANNQNKGYLLQKIYSLAEICLGSFMHQLQFLSESCALYQSQKDCFEKARKTFISLFMINGQQERAVKLCEAFLDFDLLIELCEGPHGGGEEALQKYATTFASHGFSTHLFQYYSRRRRLGKVVKSSKIFPSSLVESENQLKWLHQIDTDDFTGASTTLKVLEEKENCPERKLTLLSLAKLAALAAGHGGESQLVSELDSKMYDINYELMAAGDQLEQE